MKTLGGAKNALGIIFEVMDDTKELSKENKAINNTVELTYTCECGNKIILNHDMFSDNIPSDSIGFHSECGWEFKCPICGKYHNINEDAFDTFFEYLYDEDLITEDEDYEEEE